MCPVVLIAKDYRENKGELKTNSLKISTCSTSLHLDQLSV